MRLSWGGACLALFLLIPAFPGQSSAQDANAITVRAADHEVEGGQEVIVSIEGNNLAHLYASEIQFQYDADKLELLKVNQGLDGGFPIIKQTSGHLLLAQTRIGDDPGISGDAQLYELIFNAKGKGLAAITLTSVKKVFRFEGQLVEQQSISGHSIQLQIHSARSESSSDQFPSGEAEEILDNGQFITLQTIHANQLVSALGKRPAGSDELTLTLPDGSGTSALRIPAQEISNAAARWPDTQLIIATETASLHIPLKWLAEIAASLSGREPNDQATIEVRFEQLSAAESKKATQAVERNGAETLTDPIDFRIFVEVSGNRTELNDFGSQYIERTLTLPQSADPNQTTAVMIHTDTSEIQFVPAIFTRVNGKPVVIIKRNGNSIYSVVHHVKSFVDMDSHWAKEPVNLLASKLLVQGVSETAFAPDHDVTRAQFAAMLVRALGLSVQPAGSTRFEDVDASDWFAQEVAAALQAGLVEGVSARLFAPNEVITREQMAVMMSRAVQFTGAELGQTGPSLDSYKDGQVVSRWASTALDQMSRAGIIAGRGEHMLASTQTATRAEAAVVLVRLLRAISFINE